MLNKILIVLLWCSTVTASDLQTGISAWPHTQFLTVTGDSIAEGHVMHHSLLHLGPSGYSTYDICSNLWVVSTNLVVSTNYGLGGATWANVLSTTIQPALSVQPKYVLIHCGVNDLATSRTWANVLADMNAVRSICQQSNTLMILDDIFPWHNGTSDQRATLLQWNTNYDTWASTSGVYRLHSYSSMEDTADPTDILPIYDQGDGVHISPRAYTNWAGLILTNLVGIEAHPDITNGLVGWWPMDEGSGSTLHDRSGNGNDGTLYNSPAWISGWNGSNALSFTASSSTYVEIHDSESLNVTNTGSLCFWTKIPTYPSSSQGMVCKGDSAIEETLNYGVVAGGSQYFWSKIGTQIGKVYCDSGPGRVATNTWILLSMTWNSAGVITFYMNGLLLGTGTGNGYGAKSAGYPLRIGANGAASVGNYFDGAIQGVRIYNRELSAEDVNSLYTSEGGTQWYLPDGYLASLTKPIFATGNTLPHLTYWGQGSGAMSSNAVVELAKDWYYCLSLSYYATPTVASNTSVAGTFDWAMANMSATNSNYKLSVILDRTFTNPPAALYCTNAAGAYATNISGVTEYRVCPESDLQGAGDYWTNITSYWVDSLKTINSNGPIAIILNGGEYGLDVSAWGNFAWAQDPRVQAASVMTTPFCLQTNGWWDWSTLNTNGMSWAHYAALNKSRQLGYLTASINTNFPSRELSIFYHTGDEQGRQWNSDPHSYLYWKDLYSGWGWWSSYMNTNTDLPSCELYYSRTGWWTNEPPFVDLLTQYLNQVGYNFSIGYTNNYSWVEGGDDEVDGLSNVMTYTGFLKCLYICGMRGAIAGYFTTPNGPVGSLEGGLGFNAPFPASSPPHWIQQLIQLSRVHALFSYLDSFTTNSSLISGPQMHVLSLDQPAYEFTNTVARANDRVVARKHRSRDEWLVCAWAADGVTTNVTVTIPTLGTKTLTALPEGNIYRGTTTKFGPVNEYGEIIIPSRVSNLRVSTIRGK